jgi:2-octaprenyl-6-methoxyphenol hydroxylase
MQKKIDFIISGSGFISLIFCLILKKNQKNFLVFEKFSKEALLMDDKKSFALSSSTVNLLKNLEVWDDEIENLASPIKNIYIYDDSSKNQKFEMDFCIFENQTDPMGFMLDSFILKKKLIEKIGPENILWNHSYINFEILENDQNFLVLENYETNEKIEIISDYFFISEGKNSKFYEYFDIKSFEFNYEQTAMLFKIRHSNLHNFSALEKFFEDGMIATLPLKNQNESSIVWIIKNEYLDKISQEKFLEILSKRIDFSLGKIEMQNSKEKIAKYSLSLKFLSKVSYKNVFFIGDSAHAIHPVAGQGLNLAIADLLRITKFLNLSDFDVCDQNINSFLSKFIQNSDSKTKILNLYSMFFNLQMIGFTHFLNILFVNRNPIKRFFRNKAISLFGNSAFLNKFLKNNATGTS